MRIGHASASIKAATHQRLRGNSTLLKCNLKRARKRPRRLIIAAATRRNWLCVTRYFYLHVADRTTGAIGTGICYDSDSIFAVIPFPVTMRANPAYSQVGASQYYRIWTGGTSFDFSGFDGVQDHQPQAITVYNNGEPTGMTAGTRIRAQNSAAEMKFDAEL